MMRSIQLVSPRRLELRDMAEPPEPGPGELLVRVRAVGVCGSDLHWYTEGRIGAFPATYPLVLGHEPAGEVAAVGPGVSSFQPGDRVAVEPTLSCGHCEFCLRGRHNNCIRSSFMGSPQAPGLFRDYALVPQGNATKFPAAFTFVRATLIEPLAVIMHMLELIEIGPTDTVAVLGAGPIGMLAAAVARACGAPVVISVDRLAHRRALALRMGATVAVELGGLAPAVLDLTRGLGASVVIDAAGDLQTINTGLAIARPGGVFVLAGIPSVANLPIDLHSAMAKEIRIQTLKRSNHRSAPAIELLAREAVPDALITHAVAAGQAPEAVEMLAEYRDGVGKLVVRMDS
jgi:L-iditol 2-dehydrogenase